MNDTTNTYSCKQCCESVKRGAKICPHCSSEQHPASSKTCRKNFKVGLKLVIACVAFLLIPTLIGSGIIYGLLSEKDGMDKWLVFLRHCFFALVCLHFLAFHIIYDEDEKKGGDDGGGGGGGGE